MGYTSWFVGETCVQKTIYSRQAKALRLLLRGLRLEAGLTQQQLAERLGRPQSFVAKVEAGQRRIDVVELLMITEALGASAVGLVRALSESIRTKPAAAKKGTPL